MTATELLTIKGRAILDAARPIFDAAVKAKRAKPQRHWGMTQQHTEIMIQNLIGQSLGEGIAFASKPGEVCIRRREDGVVILLGVVGSTVHAVGIR